MKRFVAFVLGCLVLVMAVSVCSADSISMSSNSVQVGNDVWVTVTANITDHSDMTFAQLAIEYDDAVVTIQDAIAGSAWSPSVLTNFYPTLTLACSGTTKMALLQMDNGSSGIDGSGLEIAKFKFHGISVATSPIKFSCQHLDQGSNYVWSLENIWTPNDWADFYGSAGFTISNGSITVTTPPCRPNCEWERPGGGKPTAASAATWTATKSLYR